MLLRRYFDFLRSIALMTKRAREAEALLKSASSGQSGIVAVASSRPSNMDDDANGGGSAEYLDLKYRYKNLEKENKKIKIMLKEAELRELDLLDERAENGGDGSEVGDGDRASTINGSAPNTSRSMRGRAAIRIEEMNSEKERISMDLKSKINAMNSAEKKYLTTLSSKDSDLELMTRKMESIEDQLEMEKEKTTTLRTELKSIVKRLARYERQAQTSAMEQDLATSALEIENARQAEVLNQRDLLKREQSKAAVALQAKLRGANQRKKHRQMIQNRKNSATMLQSQWRLKKSKKKVDAMKAAGMSNIFQIFKNFSVFTY